MSTKLHLLNDSCCLEIETQDSYSKFEFANTDDIDFMKKFEQDLREAAKAVKEDNEREEIVQAGKGVYYASMVIKMYENRLSLYVYTGKGFHRFNVTFEMLENIELC